MRGLLPSWWLRIGVALLILGSGPLVFIIVAAKVGLWPDRDPNPVGPGLLFALTIWPALLCILIGMIRVRARSREPVD